MTSLDDTQFCMECEMLNKTGKIDQHPHLNNLGSYIVDMIETTDAGLIALLETTYECYKCHQRYKTHYKE